MGCDETIERIRRVRHEISAACGHEPGRLVAYYMEYQKKLSGRLVRNRVSAITPTPPEAAHE